MLHQAKERLEREGWGVLAAWASPSHDGYVGPKARSLGTMHLSGEFRLKVAECATLSDALVSPGRYEARFQGNWPDYDEVTEALQDFLAAQDFAARLKAPEGGAGHVQVFYVCGTDHANKCGLAHGMAQLSDRDVGVVVVPRDEDERPPIERPAKRVYVAEKAEGEVAALSSTEVREAFQRKDEAYINKALSPSAADLALRPTPEQREEFRADFKTLGL